MNCSRKGVIFDMDNTLLRSSIDFYAMKWAIYSFFVDHRVLPQGLSMDTHTTSTVIAEAMETGLVTDELSRRMWEIAKQHEIKGMAGAKLEDGALELIRNIHGRLYLSIVTNNARDAALTALEENGIASYFDLIVGREQMGSLKPAPDGYLRVLEFFAPATSSEWLSVGDAWVDGKASERAGIPFVAYRGDISKMKRMGVQPLAEIQDIRDVMAFVQ